MFKKAKACGIGACVEVDIREITVAIRDSKQRESGTILEFTHAEWRAFITGVKADEFDI